jgi:hypothetical protein
LKSETWREKHLAKERTFDYDYLRKLMRDHPEWRHRQLAAAVTEHEREGRKNPRYPAINAGAVASTAHRYRDIWTDQGDEIRVPRNNPMRKSQPFYHLPRDSYYSHPIQALRTLGTMARGEPVTEKRRREAENLVLKLTTQKKPERWPCVWFPVSGSRMFSGTARKGL